MTSLSASEKGLAFELWVRRLFDELGVLRVRHDVYLSRKDRFGRSTSQIDLVYGLFSSRYVECKYHEPGKKVPLEDVSKFASVLRLQGIPLKKGMMVTNTSYHIRAQQYARQTKMILVDREKLVRLDWKRTYMFRSLIQAPTKAFDEGLEERIKEEFLFMRGRGEMKRSYRR